MTSRVAYIVLALFVLGGCSGPNLRVDDFRFGNKRVGLQAEDPIFKAGEEVRLSFALRGFKADASGNGKATCQTTISPDMEISKQLPSTENHSFKINSEITSLEFRDTTFVIPINAAGDYELSVTVKDEVGDKETVHKAPFKVEASQDGQSTGVVDSLERKSALNSAKICAGNLLLIQTGIDMYATGNEQLPNNLGQLTPDYLVSPPECPVALKDTYSASYKSGESGYTLYCSGHHHSAAGIPENFPALRESVIVYRHNL